ncbi:putative YccA/Bax inhibitor family protein [Leucobacter exalbidus]|uniref:YccA/Bax inhibitor family protein n=1 Tax=Leucobacter exalbidus TaxID=662960 RepID=A0A940PTS6_9MICO|nr:Bax inhibitor-1/YccA family protein [Leucobacter exalbidus]MBP1327349.1 putative YccA/Bax inhibitor family protein [Leucobacter exalbidus]
MSNPALSKNPALNGKSLTAEELRRIYDQPAAQTQRPGVDQPATDTGFGAQQPPVITPSDKPMTYENTISKTVGLFLIVVAFAAVGWFIPALMLPGAIIGLVLGLVNSFKKEPSVPLIMLYGVFQGLFLGGISGVFEATWPGIVSQALIGTFSVFAVTLLLFRSGKVRTSPKMTKIVLIAMVGYALFSLINFGMMMFGAMDNPWGMRGVTVFGIPLGVIVGLLAVFLAAYSLVMDFELIQNGVKNRVPEKWGWSAAFGLMVTLIWLYVEILRILAILRGD